MIRELAILTIDAAQSDAFEATFEDAHRILADSIGCRWASIDATVDDPQRYVLQVGWDRLEDHVVAFAESAGAKELAEGFGSFFVADPVVVHIAD